MSDTLETAATAAAENPAGLNEAVAANHAEPAPSDPFAAFMRRAESFMTQVHERIGAIETALSAMAPAAGADIAAVVATVNGLIGSLESHFSGKIALPAPVPIADPPSSPGAPTAG